MFRWDDLGVLLAIHRGGTMAAAGAALGLDASTASRRLRALEAELGTLFDRTPSGLVATDLAHSLLPYAEQAEAAVHGAAAQAAATDVEATGVVRLAVADAFASYFLCPALPEFLDTHPGLRLELVVSSGQADLLRREADLAIRLVRPTEGKLIARRVASSGAYGAVVHRSYADAHPDLSADAVDWIGWDASCAHFPEARLYERLVGRAPRLACDNLIIMVEAMLAGAGAVLLPTGMTTISDELVLLDEPRAPEFELSIWIVTHRALRDVPRIRAVSDWIADMMGGSVPG